MSGIAQTLTGLTVGQSYVLRVPIRYGSHRAQPRIAAKDMTNDGYITWLDGPWLWGYHDGGDNQAALSDSFAPRWPVTLVGATVRNITDGSSGPITATGSSVTATLSGGTDNDWDDGDEYRIDPNPAWVWAETFTFHLPTVARNSVPADCDSCEWMVLNLNDGEIYVQQFEVQENLIDNPSMETGSGDPWVPDGWGNSGLIAGDTEQELVDVHSGGSALQFNSAMLTGRYLSKTWTPSTGFFAVGGWGKGDGANYVRLTRAHSTTINNTGVVDATHVATNDTSWEHMVRVRMNQGSDFGVRATAQSTNPGYLDDLYVFELDDVGITASPASEALSAEASGIRVDGGDVCTFPITGLEATSGDFRFTMIPRHDGDSLRDFRTSFEPQIFSIRYDASWLIEVGPVNDAAVRMRVKLNGANTDDTFDPASYFTAGVEAKIKVIYDDTDCKLYIDDVLVATCSPAGGIDFGENIPNTGYLGGSNANAPIDSVFK